MLADLTLGRAAAQGLRHRIELVTCTARLEAGQKRGPSRDRGLPLL
jgi:hypothetical protein